MADGDDGTKKLFRAEALGALGGGNRLNTLSPIIEPRTWIVTASLSFLLLTVVIWGFAGRIPITVIGSGIFLRGEQLDTCNARSDGYVVAIERAEGERVARGERIATIALGSGDAGTSEVFSPRDGRLLCVEAEPGDFVVSGQSVALLTSGSPRPTCLAFMPLSDGKSVAVGMPVRVRFATAGSAGTEQAVGRISQVDRFITSHQKALGHVPAAAVVSQIEGQFGAVVAVTVEFDEDATGAGGVRWAGGAGSADLLIDGAPCDIEVFIDEIRPVSLVFPGLADISGASR
jgi:hypothetical protein